MGKRTFIVDRIALSPRPRFGAGARGRAQYATRLVLGIRRRRHWRESRQPRIVVWLGFWLGLGLWLWLVVCRARTRLRGQVGQIRIAEQVFDDNRLAFRPLLGTGAWRARVRFGLRLGLGVRGHSGGGARLDDPAFALSLLGPSAHPTASLAELGRLWRSGSQLG
jgi:hypothetical protein